MRGSGARFRFVLPGLLLVLGAISPATGTMLSPGDLLVADYGDGTIRHFSPSGVGLGVFVGGLQGPDLSRDGLWLAQDPAHNIYVSNAYGPADPVTPNIPGWGVVKFSPAGDQLLALPAWDYRSTGVAVAAEGTIYVGRDNGSPVIYGADGVRQPSVPPAFGSGFAFEHVGALKIDEGTQTLWMEAREKARVGGLVAGGSLATGEVTTVRTGGLNRPGTLAIDARGDLYIGNRSTFAIEKWSQSGEFLGIFAQLSDAYDWGGLDFDQDGNLYAVNAADGTVHKFDPTGADLGVFATGLLTPRDILVVSVPEPAFLGAILPRLPREIRLGLGLRKATMARLQHVTAWGATAVLRAVQIPARQRGVDVDLPSVTVRVAEACAGHLALELLLVWAIVIAYVSPAGGLPLKLALIVAAVPLAFEANVLRVAGIAMGLEYSGQLSSHWKEWIGRGAIGLALLQLTGLGRLAARGSD